MISASPAPVAIHVLGTRTDGTTVSIPDDLHGKPLILVVGFSRGAAKPSSEWTDALQASVGSRATVIGVAVLDKVPGFFRGYVRSAIDKQIGPPIAGNAEFVTTFDGGSLRRNAPPGNDDDPIVYVFHADGSTSIVERSRLTPEAEATVERAAM